MALVITPIITSTGLPLFSGRIIWYDINIVYGYMMGVGGKVNENSYQ